MHKKIFSLLGLIIIVSFILLLGFVTYKKTVEDRTESPASVREVSVTIKNTSEEVVLAPQLMIIHQKDYTGFNFLGRRASKEFEILAELGNPESFADTIKDLPEVYEVVILEDLLLPNSSKTIDIGVADAKTDAAITLFSRYDLSNDSVFWIDRQPLTDEEGNPRSPSLYAQVIDAGTEKNYPIGSGSDKGQSNAKKGVANIDDGEATEENVKHSEQTNEFILFFGFVPKS